MTRARLLAASAAFAALAAALLLARVAFAPDAPPPVTLAVPAPGASPLPVPAASPDAPPARTGPPDAADLRAALAALDRARAAAFADPAAADPDAWATRTCPCHAADAATLRALARDGLALVRPTVTIEVLDLAAPPTGARAELLLTDRLGAYTAVDPSGAAVRRWPPSPPRRWRVTLVHVGGRWLFDAVARAP